MNMAPLRILLVEDNEDDYIIIRDLLSDMNNVTAELEWLSTYDEALAALKTHTYDVCLMDYHLDGHTGLELLQEMVASIPTPMILLTGNEDYDVDVAATKAGAADYLLKGHINAPLLDRSIRYAIEHKRANAALRRSEERYRAFVGNSSEAIWCCELEEPISVSASEDEQIDLFYRYGYLAECNEAFALLYGFSHQKEMLGTRMSELLTKSNPDNVEYLRAFMRAHYRLSDAESCQLDRDGQTKYFLNNLVGIIEGGWLYRVWGTQRDITQRREDEATRRQSARDLRQLAAQLADERARLAAAQSVAKIGSWETELATGRVLWSQENYRIFEIEREEFDQTHTGFLKFVHPNDRADLHAAFEQSFESQHSSALEHRIVLANGEIKFVEERWQIERDDTGTPLRAVGTTQDITERKQASAQLQYQKSLLEAQTETSLDGILVVSNEGEILSYNQRCIEMWEIPLQVEAKQRDALALQAVLDKLENPQEFLKRIEYLYENHEEKSHEELALRDGRVFDRYSAPITSPDNAYYGRVWYFRDVTERCQSEQALRLSDERFSILSRATNDAVWDWNLETDALWWNEGFETLFGYDRGEIEPGVESWNTRLHPDDLERITDEIHQAIEGGGQSWSGEYSFRCADGSYSAIFDRGFIIRDENQRPIRMVGSMQDITKRKRVEEELRTSEEKFQSIVANVPGMVYQFQRHTDGALSWPFISEGCRELLEVEPDEIKGNPNLIVEIIHPDDKSDFERSLQESDAKMLPWSWEGRLQLRSGKTKWVQGASSPQVLPDGGVLCTGLLIDITARKKAEKQRDRFFTMSLDMLGIIGQDGYLQRVNPAFVETLGFSESELLEIPFRERVHPEDREATEVAAQNLMQGVPLTDLVNRYRAKNGAWRWLEWRSVAAPDEGVVYAAARDITDRKEAESALLRMRDELEERVVERTAELAQSNVSLHEEIGRREQAMLEIRVRTRQQEAVAELGRRALANVDLDILFNGAAALISTTLNADVCSILEILPGAENFLVRAGVGLPENAVGQAEITSGMETPAGYTFRTGEPVIIADVGKETRFEITEMARRQGIISSMNVVIQFDEVPFGVLCAGSIKGRVFTENDVHSLQAVANVLAAAIERHHVESEIRLLNSQLELANEHLRIENIERQMTLAALRESAEVLQRARDDAEHARESAERANMAKSEFLSRMSHELRTPLNAILGFGQILAMRSREGDSQQQDNIQQILKAGRHLLDLINEVLDIARIEAGHLSLSPEPTMAGRLVREALDMVLPLANERRIELINQISDEHAARYVIADQQRLKQVLLNLLSNAVKYNCDGGNVRIFCEIYESAEHKSAEHKSDGREANLELAIDSPVDSENNAAVDSNIQTLAASPPIAASEYSRWLRFAIRDTGPGLNAQEIGRLFTPFERLSAAHSQIEGTGIGLALCKRLVEAMSGRVGVQSTPGQGSTFWLELPLVSSSTVLKIAPEVEEAEAADDFLASRPMTVLYIEDNISNLSLIEHVLADLSTQITLLPAMQGSLGLEMALQHRPDLILLDVNLPDISGDVVLNRLKANPATANIPVVVLSADATPRQMEKLLSSGAAHYLTKPLDMEQFFKVLKQILGNGQSSEK